MYKRTSVAYPIRVGGSTTFAAAEIAVVLHGQDNLMEPNPLQACFNSTTNQHYRTRYAMLFAHNGGGGEEMGVIFFSRVLMNST